MTPITRKTGSGLLLGALLVGLSACTAIVDVDGYEFTDDAGAVDDAQGNAILTMYAGQYATECAPDGMLGHRLIITLVSEDDDDVPERLIYDEVYGDPECREDFLVSSFEGDLSYDSAVGDTGHTFQVLARSRRAKFLNEEGAEAGGEAMYLGIDNWVAQEWQDLLGVTDLADDAGALTVDEGDAFFLLLEPTSDPEKVFFSGLVKDSAPRTADRLYFRTDGMQGVAELFPDP